MTGHSLQTLQWAAGATGTGFVAQCECGWESYYGRDRGDAMAAINAHVTADLYAPHRSRWRRLFTAA